jgi:hypothetical protein
VYKGGAKGEEVTGASKEKLEAMVKRAVGAA